eukprot:168363-Rhodomonas_salina.2
MNEFLFACYAMGTGLRRQQIEAIFRVIDNNNNGVVEPEEFIAAFQAPGPTSLPACYAMSGTHIAYGGSSLRACSAMPGTDIAYAAMSLRDARY